MFVASWHARANLRGHVNVRFWRKRTLPVRSSRGYCILQKPEKALFPSAFRLSPFAFTNGLAHLSRAGFGAILPGKSSLTLVLLRRSRV